MTDDPHPSPTSDDALNGAAIAVALSARSYDVADLWELPGNPHRGDMPAVANSLHRFGQIKPIAVNAAGCVIAGNTTYRAAVSLGWTEIAAVEMTADEAEQHAYALADNRTAQLGEDDPHALVAFFDTVDDWSGIGWDEDARAEIAALIAEPVVTPTPDVEPADEAPLEPPPNPITSRGDVWTMGPHRVMCGSSRNLDHVEALLDGATINLAVTSPPYADRRDYDESSGFHPIRPDDYVEWFAPVAANVAEHLANDGSWLVNIKPGAEGLDRDLYVLDLVIAHVREWGWHFADEFCWQRNGVPKQPVLRLKGQFEPVYQFARDRWKFRPDNVRHQSDHAIAPVGPGRGNTSWAQPGSSVAHQGSGGNPFEENEVGPGLAYPGTRLPTFAGTHTATGHTAAYPVGLPRFFIDLLTDEGDTVYDPFMGSGSTLLAAHQSDRTGFGMEISAGYCDLIARRFQLATGIVPLLNGEPVDMLADA
jgi:site-specific DNA-methyltransferase (adenine-specific)/site-specific DNA-methyltransferase (cytosine-N4-specific)